jgi:MoxR-like ATPase
MPRELLTFAAGVLAALTALAIYSALMPASQAVTLRDVNEAVVRAMASATPRPPFSVSVYEAIAPSLVLIQTKGDEPRGGVSLSQDEARGLGSGVIVNERGLILTSLHVVERAKEIQVTFVVVGQDHFLERVLVAILAQGHLLVEGVPGLAKTLTVKTLAQTIRGSFKRIQFTPDLVPADLVGTRIYNQKTGEFATSLGPVFTNLLLADEINRAPAKVQSALLEVMQERQVTIAGETHKVPEPFLVMATQNPIETEGTYPLPEAQVDRFMMKVLVGYPTEEEEFVIVERVTGPAVRCGGVPPSSWRNCSSECRKVYVDPALIQYAVKLVAPRAEPARHGMKDLAATSPSAPARARPST